MLLIQPMKGEMDMAQAARFRGFGLAVATLLLGQTLFAQASNPEAIEQKLFTEFKLARIAADRSEVLTPGDRVVIQKPGLTMYAVASPMPPSYTYKNGRIGRGLMGLGKEVEISMRTPGGTAADYPRRAFTPGEKCWVTGLEVQKDGVVFQLFSDRYEGTRYYANLKIAFPNKKEIPTVDEASQLVAEVLTVAPVDPDIDAQFAKAPIIPVVAPALKSQQPDVSGKYDFDEGDSQLNFVSSSGCIMIGPGGAQSAGKYRVNQDTLTMDCTVTGNSFNLKIQADKLVADDGHVWLREAAAPPLPPAISVGQNKAQVTASLGQPVRVSKQGVNEIFYYKDMKVTFTNGKVTGVE